MGVLEKNDFMEKVDLFMRYRWPRGTWDRMERPSRMEMGMDDVDWAFPHFWHVKSAPMKARTRERPHPWHVKGAYERLNGGLTEKKHISWFNKSLARSLSGVSDVPISKKPEPGKRLFSTTQMKYVT